MAKRRNRGDGSLHLRKDGRWEGRAVVGYDDKGLRRTSLSPESCWRTGWTSGIKGTRNRISAPILRCPMSGEFTNT